MFPVEGSVVYPCRVKVPIWLVLPLVTKTAFVVFICPVIKLGVKVNSKYLVESGATKYTLQPTWVVTDPVLCRLISHCIGAPNAAWGAVRVVKLSVTAEACAAAWLGMKATNIIP